MLTKRVPNIRRAAPACGLAAVVLLTGCGGGNDKPKIDQTDPAAVVKGYLNALADGDGKTACAQLSPARQRFAVKALLRPTSLDNFAADCPDALKKASRDYRPEEQKLLRKATVTKAKINGRTAKLKSSASGELTLTRSGGRWVISGGIYG